MTLTLQKFNELMRAGLCLGLLGFGFDSYSQTNQPHLEAFRGVEGGGPIQLSSGFVSNSVLTLEASTNLQTWQEIGTFHDALFPYPDAGAMNSDLRFYRLQAVPRRLTNDWKNQILFPVESFLGDWYETVVEGTGIGWVKFLIVLDAPDRVYYQDSRKHPFHYQFATLRLARFKDMSPDAFDAVTLYQTNQQAILGTVLYAPGYWQPGGPSFREYGVQFVGADPYNPDDIARWFKLVQNSVFASNPATAFYIPTFEQRDMARANADALAAKGIPVASLERWIKSNECYSLGWAVGRLKYFAAPDVGAAFGDGRLRPEDVLLTDGILAETPLVAGIISLAPATPNSHTAILSKSFGIPFVYLLEPVDRAMAQILVGHKILLRATVTQFSPNELITQFTPVVRLVDLDGLNDPGFEAEMMEAKRPQPIQFLPKRSFGALSAPTDGLVPSDIQFFGGKAANYGFLRRAIPQNCPPAMGFSFDLWDAFLDQVMPSGKTLRAEVAERLAPFTNYPPEMLSLKTTLANIRDLFTKTARFSPSQEQAITNALASFNFNPLRKIRFRSSTNVEDSEHFTGAGLYDSFSGCLLDDLDGDAAGPCHCDATEVNERGVFRAIQKVYASFYNDNAFLARLAHEVDEQQVGMGVLVHHSFPDEDELANGVATLHYKQSNLGLNLVDGELVTQLGAEPVTNPSGNSVPEVLRWGTFGHTLTPKQYSSLMRLGETVMSYAEYYIFILQLFQSVGQKFSEFYPEKQEFSLDFEYKKDRNLGLVVKQVREIPAPASTNGVMGFLLDEPITLCIAQQEYGDPFGNHRLKSLWTLHTRSMRLTTSNLAQGLYTEGICQYVEDGEIRTLSGPLDSWPSASRSASGTTNYWATGAGTNQRAWQLQTAVTTTASGSQPPVFTQSDYAKTLTVNYPQPVRTLWGDRTNETAYLRPYSDTTEGALQERILIKTNVIHIETSFYWPKDAADNNVGSPAAPLERFVQTTITGLTTAPIVLTNYFSQTYWPSHHNYYEYFVFEPRLEPGISPAILAELEAADIQAILVSFGPRYFDPLPPSSAFSIIGRDGSMRDL